jgi:peptidyl-prolyl cis-trans isomerase SurA
MVHIISGRTGKRQQKRMARTMKISLVTFCSLLTVLLFAGGPQAANGTVVVDRVVAVVNDEVITLSDLQREQMKRPDVKDGKLLLEEMIDRKLEMAAAKRNGLDVTDREAADAIADIKKRNNLDDSQFEAALAREGLTLEQYRSDLKEQMTLSRLFNRFVRSGVAVDESEARAYYEKNPQQFSLPEEVRVRLLVVKVPQNATPEQAESARTMANELMDRIRKGEDFIGLIRQHSDSSTAARDGDLGFIQRGQAIAEIDEATRSLKPGEYAGPVRSGEGFLLIRLEDVRIPSVPFEKVKEEIVKTLFEQKTEIAYRAWLQTLRSDSHIENRL